MVHAWMTPYPLAATEVFRDPAPFEAQARLVLDDSVASLDGDDAPIDLRPVLIEEYATKALLGASDGSMLLVVGSRGRGGFHGLVLGSVSQHCIGHASCPVVVVPPLWAGATHRRIVVGVDGSPSSSERSSTGRSPKPCCAARAGRRQSPMTLRLWTSRS